MTSREKLFLFSPELSQPSCAWRRQKFYEKLSRRSHQDMFFTLRTWTSVDGDKNSFGDEESYKGCKCHRQCWRTSSFLQVANRAWQSTKRNIGWDVPRIFRVQVVKTIRKWAKKTRDALIDSTASPKRTLSFGFLDKSRGLVIVQFLIWIKLNDLKSWIVFKIEQEV